MNDTIQSALLHQQSTIRKLWFGDASLHVERAIFTESKA
jgi:hypothetical protein